MGGADRIAIDAARFDLCSPSPLEGVVEADDDGTIRDEAADQQTQQAACDPAARPAITVENPVVVCEARILVQPGNAQRRSDRSPPGTEDSAGDQHQYMLPGRGGKGVTERLHPSSEIKPSDIRPHPSPESNRGKTRAARVRRESLVRSQGIQQSPAVRKCPKSSLAANERTGRSTSSRHAHCSP